jgi:membrane-associated phospholipid phosphatase
MTFGRSSDGFHLFHAGAAYCAFPSGHTACTLSVVAVAQVAFPSWRLCWWSIAGVVAATLIALNYHFVGDIYWRDLSRLGHRRHGGEAVRA